MKRRNKAGPRSGLRGPASCAELPCDYPFSFFGAGGGAFCSCRGGRTGWGGSCFGIGRSSCLGTTGAGGGFRGAGRLSAGGRVSRGGCFSTGGRVSRGGCFSTGGR